MLLTLWPSARVGLGDVSRLTLAKVVMGSVGVPAASPPMARAARASMKSTFIFGADICEVAYRSAQLCSLNAIHPKSCPNESASVELLTYNESTVDGSLNDSVL